MWAIDALKSFSVDGVDIDELVWFSAVARAFQAELAALNMDEPEWLSAKARELRREIRTRSQDRIEKRIREYKARIEALKPPEEKRAAMEAEIQKLEEMAKNF